MSSGGFLCLIAGNLPFCGGCQESRNGRLDPQDAAGSDPPVSVAEDVQLPASSPPAHEKKNPTSKQSLPGAADEAAGGCVADRVPSAQELNSEGAKAAAHFARHGFLSSGTFASQGTLLSCDGPMVTFDEEFDFYEPNTRQMKIMKMADVKHDVLHQRDQKSSWMKRFLRRKSVDERANADGGRAAGELSDAESESSENSGSSDDKDSSSQGSGEKQHEKGEEGDKGAMLRRQPSAFDHDNVTNWATLIAKLLRRRVHGILGTAMRTIHKRRNSRISTHQLATAHAQYVLPSVRVRAQLVVDQARSLAKAAQEAPDRYDSTWQDQNTISYLFGEDYVDTLMLLANTVRKVVAAQPVLCEASAPCRVFGDIHGQLRDLLILFRAFGMPGERSPSFVFNGDFVDRGTHSLEVVGLLFALKIILPESVWLVRGNHEDRSMNERYGFENECYSILGADFGPKTYELIHRAFDELPIACLISEKILVVHGGIGEGKWSLNDLRAVQRPLRERQLASDPMVWNVLWSDPIEDDVSADQHGVFGVHASPRSSTGLYKFGWNVTKTFCAANGLGLIIRSHQSKEGSLGFSVMHDKMLVRVFSARDYEEHGNDGAVILVNLKDPDRRRGPLIVRPQVMRSFAKQIDEDDPSSPRKVKSRKNTWKKRISGF